MTQISLSEGVYTYNIQVVMPKFNSGTGTKRETGFYSMPVICGTMYC